MTQDPDPSPSDELARLFERLAQDPQLLDVITRQLASNPSFRRSLNRQLRGRLAEDVTPVAPALPTKAEVPVVVPSPRQPQDVLDRSVLSTALLDFMTKEPYLPARGGAAPTFKVVIDLNLLHAGSRLEVNRQLQELIQEQIPGASINITKSNALPQYLFATLTEAQINALVKADLTQAKTASPDDASKVNAQRLIYRIWPDFKLSASLNHTGATIKAEAARVSFAASGQGVTWAVLDSGIQGDHPHFARYDNLNVAPLQHQNMTDSGDALTDEFGHGTHVAGIIAGGWQTEEGTTDSPKPYQKPFVALTAFKDNEDTEYRDLKLTQISGIAPRCKLVSYKVLDSDGTGEVSNLLAAIAHIQDLNGNGKLLQIHGVNISAGYTFDPEWFACGQSPLCVEVDRLVRSGVIVVVAAGNTGYGSVTSKLLGSVPTTLALTINDPGNAQLAITVGATHRDAPHQYGVSYFSSKGPTGDGRLKPDLVAPGERVLSCAAGQKRAHIKAKGQDTDYLEDSGTSMAAPHVSGAAAAFLSAQKEFIGRPEEVKRILMSTATNLGRHHDFQGAGLVDVMRAIQSV